MSVEQLRLIIIATITAFGGTGVWAFLGNRHRPTIDQNTAAVAMAMQAGDKALAIADRSDRRSNELEARMDALEVRLNRWVCWGTDIVNRWAVYRQSEIPPVLPE